ncbi:ATP-dependent peptidase [Hibiscus syriacus]|uniref:ATP-dependent peptidase n=1 Tax=Hibiscus syriacus TaxID=106335 RepID=A0A6A2XXT4_HIBSY|nr:ATP-dependent peptidase [Hibiscus syriacus]
MVEWKIEDHLEELVALATWLLEAMSTQFSPLEHLIAGKTEISSLVKAYPLGDTGLHTKLKERELGNERSNAILDSNFHSSPSDNDFVHEQLIQDNEGFNSSIHQTNDYELSEPTLYDEEMKGEELSHMTAGLAKDYNGEIDKLNGISCVIFLKDEVASENIDDKYSLGIVHVCNNRYGKPMLINFNEFMDVQDPCGFRLLLMDRNIIQLVNDIVVNDSVLGTHMLLLVEVDLLIGDDSSVRKSSLLLQTVALMGRDCDRPASVIYEHDEESLEQISSRPLSPQALIVDSIQNAYLREVTETAEGLSLVRTCTSALLRFVKKTNIPILLAGHVKRSDDIARSCVLVHIIDVALCLEREKYSLGRWLCFMMNCLRSVDKPEIFEMSQLGLQTVLNSNKMFFSNQNSDSELLVELIVVAIMDESRALLNEIQSLCVSSSAVFRHVNGTQLSRVDIIISVLIKEAGLKIQENAIFLNAFIALTSEIVLGGESRMVPMMGKGVSTVTKLGYKKCIVLKSVEESLATLDLGKREMIDSNDLKRGINTMLFPLAVMKEFNIYITWNLLDKVLFGGAGNVMNRKSNDAVKDHTKGTIERC